VKETTSQEDEEEKALPGGGGGWGGGGGVGGGGGGCGVGGGGWLGGLGGGVFFFWVEGGGEGVVGLCLVFGCGVVGGLVGVFTSPSSFQPRYLGSGYPGPHTLTFQFELFRHREVRVSWGGLEPRIPHWGSQADEQKKL